MQNDNLKSKIIRSIILSLLLFLVFLLPFLSMRNFSPVGDEIAHLPSGYSYLKTREIKLNPQHPPLIKILAALPLLFLDLKFDANDPNLIGPEISEWQFGRDFVLKNGVDRVMFWGRIPMILLSVLLGWYIYKWGRDFFGYKAGLAGLFIYAFMPNIIAHSQLVTTDMGLAAFSFISLYYLWKFTIHGGKNNLIYSGLVLGLALGSKFSAIFLLPIFFVLLAMDIYKKYRNSSLLLKVNSFLKVILPIFGFAFLVMWGLYFFPKDPLFYWDGLNTVYADRNPNYFYYLNGNFSHDGWWYYFIWALIIKTPVPFLIVLLAALLNYKKNNLNFLNHSFIFLPVILFLFMTSWKAYNIGVRYVLLIYPFLILFVGGQILYMVKSLELKFKSYSSKLKIFKPKLSLLTLHFLLLMLPSWYVFSAVNVYPNHLAYFNELVGGSKNGHKYLDDSNVEWGQDLKRLAEYQKNSPDLKVGYAWGAFIDLERYGIKNIVSLSSKENLWLNPKGKYAISTNIVIRTGLASQKFGDDRLNWMDRYKPIDRIGQSFFIYEF